MNTTKIELLLQGRKEQGKGALLPYFTAGYPDDDATEELIRQADRLGAPVVEVGFPYCDSIADGPVIQNSFHDALARGHTVERAWRIVSSVGKQVSCAIVAMVSYAIAYRVGLERFVRRAADAGLDGLIVPDLPVEEAASVTDATARAGLCHIGLVAPTTSASRREQIAQRSSGFVYKIAVAGTTGERADLPEGLAGEVNHLRKISGLPVCVGFGIGTPAQVRDVCRVCDGAIVGSALIRRLRDGVAAGLSRSEVIDGAAAFLAELMAGAEFLSASK